MAAEKEVKEKLHHQLNCLSSENKAVRKSALLSLKQLLSQTSCKEKGLELSHEDIIKALLVALSDPSEACRDISISVLQGFLLQTNSSLECLSIVVPVLVARLGQTEIVEPSEEVRLSLMGFVAELIKFCTAGMAPFIGDMVLILQQTLCDPYPEVKKASAMCVVLVAQQNPVAFHRQGETLVKPLLKGMTHQHSKVRVECLKALGCAVQHLPATALDEAFPTLAQKTYDASTAVRKCLVETLGTWLLHLVDRYSYHHKLVPLLLTCLSDDSEELRTCAKEAWQRVGKMFEEENEADLKDQLDFNLSLEAPMFTDYERPRLGCRVIVQRNFHKFLPSVLRDLSDWTVTSRTKASQLLYSSLTHLEEHITQSLRDLLNALYRTCCDEEQVVASNAMLCSSIIGHFVPADVWCKLVRAAVGTASGSTRQGRTVDSSVAVGPLQCEGCLLCFASLLQGGRKDQIFAELNGILDCLCDLDLFATKHWGTIQAIFLCAEAILARDFKMSSAQERCFLTVLLRLGAARMDDDLWHRKVQSNIAKLSTCQGYPDVSSLFLQNGRDMLLPIVVDCKHWTSLSPNHLLFLSFLKQLKNNVFPFLDIVIPVFSVCLSSDSEPEVQLSCVAALLELIIEPQTEEQRSAFCQHSEAIVRDVIIPNSVWTAGRTASALRTSLMSCLQALLELSLLQEEAADRVLDIVLPQVLSCLDDQNGSARLAAVHVLKNLLRMRPPSLTVDCLHSMYAHILKRLDDSSEEIRMQSTETLAAYVKSLPDDYDGQLYKAHCEVLYATLLIHLDDSSEQMKDAVLRVLKDASRLNKELLRSRTTDVREMHKTTKFCDALLEHMSA